jgi:hypothetical protein
VWDDSAEKTFSLCGVLDARNGLLRKSRQHEGILYPTVATNSRIAVIAGIRSGTREIVIVSENLLENSGTASVKN